MNISLPVAGIVELRRMIFDIDAAHRLDAERQRRHVEQQHLAVAGDQDVGLHRGAERDDFVGVQLAVRRPAEQLADQAADQRNPRRSADQHDFVDLRRARGRRRPAPGGTARACARRSARISASNSARVKRLRRSSSVSSRSDRSHFAWMTALRIS